MSRELHGPDHRRGQRHRPGDRAGAGTPWRAAGPDRLDSAGLESLAKDLGDAGARFVGRPPTSPNGIRSARPSRRSRPHSDRSTCSWRAPGSAHSPWCRTWLWTRSGVPSRSTCSASPSRSRPSSWHAHSGEGHLVGVASLAGYRGFPWMISYSASKAGLIAYLEAMRPGLARRGITVTTVCPGFVRTAMSTHVPYKRKVKMMEPEQAARHLVQAILRRPRNCVFPWNHADRAGRFSGSCPIASSIGDAAGRPKALVVDF